MKPLFSTSWYRVAALVPRLRPHAEIHRHRYRGQTWYVLEDRASERFHRFLPEAYLVLGLMDGRRTVQEIWDLATTRLGDDAPTQDEVIQLLGQLHAGDLLQSDVPPDAAELLDREQRQRRRRVAGKLMSVFSWQIPIFDPDRLLRAVGPLVRPLFGWFGAVLWLAVVTPALVLLATHWTDLTRGMVDRVFTVQNLAALWLLFPAIKALHEFGHAFATRVWGGQVHDMGVMFLVFTPVPYVDASASWAFPEKWRRIVVGAAGMIVEVFLAAIALYLWILAEPGLVRTLAFNTILIAGISTVVFNLNPLLRFDGYYMLADWLEIPNLRQRANQYLGYVCERYLFGRRQAEAPLATRGERAWFVFYAVASFVYRILVVLGILLFLGDWWFVLAVVFAAVTAVTWIGVPLGKGLVYLVSSPRLRRVRLRAMAVTAVLVAAVVGVVGFVPLPHRTRLEGVVWVPDEAGVRSGTEGFIDKVLVPSGRRVKKGDAVIALRDPALLTKVQELSARRRELEARYDEQYPVDRVKAEMVRDELRYVQESIGELRRRIGELTVRSRADGVFVVPVPEDLPGRFVKKGELLGYAVELDTVTVRAVVAQEYIELVRDRTRAVEVRLAERLDETLPGTIRRVVPGASERLPTTALGSEGGGAIPVDPRDQQGVTAVGRVFQLDVDLEKRSALLNVGGRAYLRLDHTEEPLATRWYHQLRQLFLGRFHV